ncbi:hypothetical protein ATANTOWER_013343 [Ataeniobius toweri]|uniref:Uncharacterized protein n=1 Tax=Ataeniobius toweri TaxID=208326 RepID=A0ABU7BI28_9TELE|nr:hypothetical protein [Ataeniobius toweri]
MIVSILYLIIPGFITSLSDGAGVLPEDPLNGYVNGTVMFWTNLSPPPTPFLSVAWTFGTGSQIVTSLPSLNTEGPEYEGRINLFRSNGSLELRDLKLTDSGNYTVIIETADNAIQTGRTRLNIYGEQLVKSTRK